MNAQNPMMIFKGELTQPALLNRLAEILPRGYDPRRFALSLLTASQNSPALMQCPRPKLIAALVKAAYLGLEVDGVRGYAYIIPYGQEPTLIPGYKGLLKMAKESGAIRSLEARVVRDGDFFELEFGTSPRVTHRPVLDGEPGGMIGVYAVAILNDNADPAKCSRLIEWMNTAQIESIRARSRAGRSGPWVSDFEEMARKTVTRRLLKYVPAGEKLSAAVAMDEKTDAGQDAMADYMDADVIDTVAEQPKTGSNARLEARAPKRQQEPTSAPPDGPPTPEEVGAIKAQEAAEYAAQGSLIGGRS